MRLSVPSGLLLAWVTICLAAATAMRITTGDPLREWALDYAIAQVVISVSAGVAAALILSHRPGNAVGRILAMTSALQAASATFSGFDSLRNLPAGISATAPQVTTLDRVSELVEATFWVPAILAPLLLLPPLLPDGRLPSRRWRWHLAASGLLICSHVAVLAVRVWPWAPGPLHDFNTDGTEVTTAEQLIFPAMLLLVLLSLAAVVQRFRRASGETRQQLRRLGVGLVVLALLGLLATVLQTSDSVLLRVLVALPVGGIPLTIAFAVVRFGWLDADVVISRAVTAGLLAGFSVILYVTIVLLVGGSIGSTAPDDGAAILATGAVAVAFQPARRRLARWGERLVYGERRSPYEVLSSYAREAAVESDEDVLLRATRLLAEGTGAEATTVWLRVDGHDRAAATWPPLRDPVPPAAGEVVQPVVDDTDRLATIVLCKDRSEQVDEGDRRLVRDLAGNLAIVLRNARLTAALRDRVEELEASRRRLVDAGDEVRRGVQEALATGVVPHLDGLREGLRDLHVDLDPTADPRLLAIVGQLSGDVDRAEATIDDVTEGIHPPLLEAEGLTGGLVTQAARLGLTVVVDGEPGPLPVELRLCVWYACLEALQNAARYAGVDTVHLDLERTSDELRFHLRDDGTGFDPATVDRGAGLTNMVDRAGAVGGMLVVTSRPGAGTVVRGRVPVPVVVT